MVFFWVCSNSTFCCAEPSPCPGLSAANGRCSYEEITSIAKSEQLGRLKKEAADRMSSCESFLCHLKVLRCSRGWPQQFSQKSTTYFFASTCRIYIGAHTTGKHTMRVLNAIFWRGWTRHSLMRNCMGLELKQETERERERITIKNDDLKTGGKFLGTRSFAK